MNYALKTVKVYVYIQKNVAKKLIPKLGISTTAVSQQSPEPKVSACSFHKHNIADLNTLNT